VRLRVLDFLDTFLSSSHFAQKKCGLKSLKTVNNGQKLEKKLPKMRAGRKSGVSGRLGAMDLGFSRFLRYFLS